MADDIGVLFEFADADEASASELRESIKTLTAAVEESETQMLLGGANDALNAIV